MHRISILVANGGLWGNFTRIHWISQYLQYPIHLWNKINGQIMVKVGENTQWKFKYYVWKQPFWPYLIIYSYKNCWIYNSEINQCFVKFEISNNIEQSYMEKNETCIEQCFLGNVTLNKKVKAHYNDPLYVLGKIFLNLNHRSTLERSFTMFLHYYKKSKQ